MTLSPKSIAVLGYHKIGEPPPGSAPTWFYISEEIFAQQLQWLVRAEWTVISLPAFLRGLDQPESLPDKSALITFDDACKSISTAALRQLQRFGFPAAVFVPTEYIGGSNTFDHAVEPNEPVCEWEDLKALQDAGHSIQSHGASHRRFSELDPQEQEEELVRSKRCLEEELGNSVTAFGFPYGDNGRDPDATDALLERAGYRCAFLYGGGRTAPSGARYRIPRLAMGPDSDMERLLGK